MIPSRDINNDQRIMQYHWKRGKTGHLLPKVVLLDTTFLSFDDPCKKSKILFFQEILVI